MGKNWLIRTKSNHILGPVSREKVIELFQNGSIKPDDEICSGNGYWFFIRELDLVNKYLLGSLAQSFNPISEAKDVLTSKIQDFNDIQVEKDDITMIGGIHLTDLKDEKSEEKIPNEVKISEENQKKKNNLNKKKKTSIPVNQNFLKYIALVVFIILFLIIYFRKTIFKSYFRLSAIDQALSSLVIDTAQAQENQLQKKNLLNSIVQIDQLIFKTQIDLEGLKVISHFDIETFECHKLDLPAFQLAILLYPSDQYNEKFLVKMRDCVLGLKKDHLLKKWLGQLSQKKIYSKAENEKISHISEIMNSPFNLITDQKIRIQVIDLLAEMPEKTVIEKLMRSYLYLMIGNITQSDIILKSILSMSPREFYRGYSYKNSIFHEQGLLHLDKMLEKLSQHPTDRLTFNLLIEYLKAYTNSNELSNLLNSLDVNDYKKRLFLRYTELIAPELLTLLKLKNMKNLNQIQYILKKKYDFELLAYWLIPYLEIDFPISQEIIGELKKIEESDALWHSYLLADEKLADFYIQKMGTSALKSREELRHYLKSDAEFMLSLYRLLQIGDIDSKLVEALINFRKDE